jgi:hypothetical protein
MVDDYACHQRLNCYDPVQCVRIHRGGDAMTEPPTVKRAKMIHSRWRLNARKRFRRDDRAPRRFIRRDLIGSHSCPFNYLVERAANNELFCQFRSVALRTVTHECTRWTLPTKKTLGGSVRWPVKTSSNFLSKSSWNKVRSRDFPCFIK